MGFSRLFYLRFHCRSQLHQDGEQNTALSIFQEEGGVESYLTNWYKRKRWVCHLYLDNMTEMYSFRFEREVVPECHCNFESVTYILFWLAFFELLLSKLSYWQFVTGKSGEHRLPLCLKMSDLEIEYDCALYEKNTWIVQQYYHWLFNIYLFRSYVFLLMWKFSELQSNFSNILFIYLFIFSPLQSIMIKQEQQDFNQTLRCWKLIKIHWIQWWYADLPHQKSWPTNHLTSIQMSYDGFLQGFLQDLSAALNCQRCHGRSYSCYGP